MALLHRNSQKRIYLEGAIYFVTTKTKGNAPYFRDPSLAEFVVEELRLAKQVKRFLLYAYVVMPDHLHLLFQPFLPCTVSDVMHFLKRHLSRNIRILARNNLSPIGEDGHLRLWGKGFGWQRSFHFHIIRDETDFETHVHYIHNNPVKRGYVQRLEDWPWSSYRDFASRNYEVIDPVPG